MPGSLSPSRKKPKSAAISHAFPPHTKLFDLERPPRRIYLLRSGHVLLACGRSAIVDYLRPGEFFGEQSLLGPRYRYQIATCLTPVQVSTYRKSDLLNLLQKDRGFATRMLKSCALRMNRYEGRIREFVTERAERRLLLLLFRFVPPRANSGWVRLEFSPTNTEIAKTIRSTRWQVAHFMRHFQQLGWLDRRPDLWVRPEGLRIFLESPPAAR
ncbi:MAG TPA: Crp/Fnr family transcriptional regulator [Terriglobales bacterium]